MEVFYHGQLNLRSLMFMLMSIDQQFLRRRSGHIGNAFGHNMRKHDLDHLITTAKVDRTRARGHIT